MSKAHLLLKPSWRKVLSDLVGEPSSHDSVVASITVGVFAVGTIAGAYYHYSQ